MGSSPSSRSIQACSCRSPQSSRHSTLHKQGSLARPSSRSRSSCGRPTPGGVAADGARSRDTRRSVAGRSLALRIVAIRLPHVGEVVRQTTLVRVVGEPTLALSGAAHAAATDLMSDGPRCKVPAAAAPLRLLLHGEPGKRLHASVTPGQPSQSPEIRNPELANCILGHGFPRKDK